jgi:hypothetical protein
MESFGAAGPLAALAGGAWPQAGSAAPASDKATLEDAPASRSLRDKFSENIDLEIFFITMPP